MSDAARLSTLFETLALRREATGFEFTEGPLYHPDGSVYFVDIRRHHLLRWHPTDGVSIARERTGEGNGLTFDRQGRLLMCEGKSRRVSRTELDGTITTVASTYQGKRFNRPSDIVVRSDGTIYFTDPGVKMPQEERELDISAVFVIPPSGELYVGSADCENPNGIALSPDEKTLYVANSRHSMYMRAFDVNPDGSLANSRIFADMTSSDEGVPDGIRVDVERRVYCASSGGIWVFEPDGSRIGILPTPEPPSNCAFGGPDRRTLYITARTSLYSVRTTTPGITPI